jgi:hypothetical protein
MSSSVLPIRLAELEEAGNVERANGTYVPSVIGTNSEPPASPDELAGTPVTDAGPRQSHLGRVWPVVRLMDGLDIALSRSGYET